MVGVWGVLSQSMTADCVLSPACIAAIVASSLHSPRLSQDTPPVCLCLLPLWLARAREGHHDGHPAHVVGPVCRHTMPLMVLPLYELFMIEAPVADTL